MADSYYEVGILELALVLLEVAVKLPVDCKLRSGLVHYCFPQPEVQNLSRTHDHPFAVGW